ncbi:TadE/TadG family type IV pilus assembly protein [Glycocaulis sp.]|uniref:TadE/TadG family type IV pilus assembly protein n=1 Tax=Glycocaulis sp. TaxID=1969725 RepID=UPI003F707326
MMAFKRISTLAADRRGVSAVEFALIAPLLIALYVGIVQLTLGLSADRKLTAAASTIADLVAQSDIVNDVAFGDILAAGEAVMQPYSTANLVVRVSSLSADAQGNPSLEWSQGRGTNPRAAGDLPPLPAGVLLPGGGVVVVEADYTYRTPLTGSGLGQFNLTETVYMRPRRVGFVSGEWQPDEPQDPGSGGGSGSGTGSTPPPEPQPEPAPAPEPEPAPAPAPEPPAPPPSNCRYTGILAFLLCR